MRVQRLAASFLILVCGFALAETAPPAVSPDDQYVLGPDSQVQPGVPEGRVQELKLGESKVFPGYSHDTWLYLPPGYNNKQPLALMVFQDGMTFLARDGVFRVPVVLNNLIAQKAIPPMAAVFINPGASRPKASDGSPLMSGSNRSFEYDTLSADYSQFLLNEVLPVVRKHAKIVADPEGRAIAGYSSGGICAFTVAWQRPDQFRKVFTNNGSFVDIRGGHVYPDLVRASEKKPIRVFQQDGAKDALGGEYARLNWPEANKAMAAALDEKGYDHKFVFGEGTHSPKHAAAIFPDALRWLWRDYHYER